MLVRPHYHITIMTDTQRIQKLERELQDIQSELADLKLAITKLSRSADTRKESIQYAVDDLKQSVQLIFKNVQIPNVKHKPGRRLLI